MLSEIRAITDQNAHGVSATTVETAGLLAQATQITSLMESLELYENEVGESDREENAEGTRRNSRAQNGHGDAGDQ